MKLFELDATRQTKQAAKVFESYFGGSISFDALNRKQTRHMLNRVRSLIAEHRSTPSFHTSEQNPTYLKNYYQNNKEKIKQKSNDYYEDNKKQHIIRTRNYQLQNGLRG